MARNEEKAMAALNRWTAQEKKLQNPYAEKRPKIASEVTTIKECEHWRNDLLRGVATKIKEIQNAGMGEHRIRDLNDEINKDLREKKYWDEQIKNLGGPDYAAMQAKAVEQAGAEPGTSTSGYKYFGAAKDLPGVRELFETNEAPEAPRKTRKQLFKMIQPDYYGWRDEEDGMLLLAEKQAEMELVAKEMARWKAEQAKKAAKGKQVAAEVPKEAEEEEPPVKKLRIGSMPGEESDEEMEAEKAEEVEKAETRTNWKSYVDVPTMEEIDRLIIQKKKQALLSKYATPELKEERNTTNELLRDEKLEKEKKELEKQAEKERKRDAMKSK
eukprot:gnl/TRDRNA2_/TRDRNA2_179643_c0_seq1.p1 gnl/TRDRNA2_/TRDRNA2_179643_c0~~gnl/TRDRNA2_/TRDRNA2_179643_c0_seq1.p1  ORF type:complete len:363 (-),score=124.69 gnl/TRDRNA2_/TRDRNA2_179643_c0_seq1:62-1045(-)